MDNALGTPRCAHFSFNLRAHSSQTCITKITSTARTHTHTHTQPLPHAFLRRFPALPPRVRLLIPSSGANTASSSSASPHRPRPTAAAAKEGEVVEARFVHPQDALAEHRAKEIALMPPQHYILTTLADLLVGREATASSASAWSSLSAGRLGGWSFARGSGRVDASGTGFPCV
jgi:hypothetical protein